MPAGKKPRLGLVSSQFNLEITTRMASEAAREAERLGASIVASIEVPGAYEIPFAAQKLLARKEIDAVAVVGAVVKGETKHDEVIMHAVCHHLLSLQLQHKKPVGLGISGPGQTEEQAKARAEDYARRAVRAALHQLKI
ncbi:MAG: 6,7-dimethyl-8-ribityllumazine synthase [Candidatus Micrarchaeota archaeon]|nr:6,7-dimethyl-8-ribityllumazine synthase [Candidatus Micrarchaeota archaeon]